MKITIIQTNIHCDDPQRNLSEVKKLVDGCRGSDLYVLPEMWTTGFNVTSPTHIEHSGKALCMMWQLASYAQAAVCGSIAVEEKTTMPDGHTKELLYNRSFFVQPDGTFDTYDKHHLFTHGGEKQLFTEGKKPVTVEYKGWRFCLVTCYDLRFPAWCRYQEGYDALIVVANWPDKRRQAWEVLNQARAIENMSYVVAANRCGRDNACRYHGGSMVIDPLGTIIASAGNRQQTLTAEVSLEKLKKIRGSFNVLADRDSIFMI